MSIFRLASPVCDTITDAMEVSDDAEKESESSYTSSSNEEDNDFDVVKWAYLCSSNSVEVDCFLKMKQFLTTFVEKELRPK